MPRRFAVYLTEAFVIGALLLYIPSTRALLLRGALFVSPESSSDWFLDRLAETGEPGIVGLQAIAGSDHRLAYEALVKLGQVEDDAAIYALVPFLTHPDMTLRMHTRHRLVARAERALPILAELFIDLDRPLAWEVGVLLGKHCVRSRQYATSADLDVVRCWRARWQHPDPELRAFVVRMAGSVREPDPLAWLSEVGQRATAPEVLEQVALYLSLHGEAAVEPIMRSGRRVTGTSRVAFVEALGAVAGWGDRGALAFYEEMLKDPDPAVRAMAIHSALRMGPGAKSLTEALAKIASADPAENIRQAAREAVRYLRRR